MDELKILKHREIDRVRIIRVIYCFIYVFGALFIISLSTGGRLFTYKQALIFSICSIPLCFLYAITVERLGSGLGNLFTGWSSRGFNRRERLSTDLEIARHSKRQGQFMEALRIINEVLEKDRDFPDALYLKGQILWEGIKNRRDALECFQKVLLLLPESEPLHSWAEKYCQDIRQSCKEQ